MVRAIQLMENNNTVARFIKRCDSATKTIVINLKSKDAMAVLDYICEHPKSFKGLIELCFISTERNPRGAVDSHQDLSFLQRLVAIPSLRKLKIDVAKPYSLTELSSLQGINTLTLTGLMKTEIDLAGIEFLPNLVNLEITYVRCKNLGLINTLAGLKALRFASNGCDGRRVQGQAVIDLDLSGLSSLRELNLLCSNLRAITFSPDARPTHIIIENGSDLSEISGLNSSELLAFISGNSKLTSLEFLKEARLLRTLDVSENPLTDLSHIPTESLEHLFLGLKNNNPTLLRTTTGGKKTLLEIAYLALTTNVCKRINYAVAAYDDARMEAIYDAKRSLECHFDDDEDDDEDEEDQDDDEEEDEEDQDEDGGY